MLETQHLLSFTAVLTQERVSSVSKFEFEVVVKPVECCCLQMLLSLTLCFCLLVLALHHRPHNYGADLLLPPYVHPVVETVVQRLPLRDGLDCLG